MLKYLKLKRRLPVLKLLLISIVLLTQSVFATTYYAKVEPYKLQNIASNVVGEVLFVDENMLGKKLTDKDFITIDTKLEEAELHDVEQKIAALEQNILINQKILENVAEVLKRKRANYKKTEALTIKSRIDKDREFYDLITSQNSYYATQKEINSLKNSLADLHFRQEQLQKSIADRHIEAKGFVLYSLGVAEGEVVTVGKPLAVVADCSKALLSIYVDAQELSNIEKKRIYIDEQPTAYRIDRIIPIADSVNISKYKIQIIIKAPKIFSKLVKVELREE